MIVMVRVEVIMLICDRVPDVARIPEDWGYCVLVATYMKGKERCGIVGLLEL